MSTDNLEMTNINDGNSVNIATIDNNFELIDAAFGAIKSQKSYDEAVAAGTSTSTGAINLIGYSVASLSGFQFPQKMTGIPTVTFYGTDGSTGASLNLVDIDGGNGIIVALTATALGEGGLARVTASASTVIAGRIYKVHYTAIV